MVSTGPGVSRRGPRKDTPGSVDGKCQDQPGDADGRPGDRPRQARTPRNDAEKTERRTRSRPAGAAGAADGTHGRPDGTGGSSPAADRRKQPRTPAGDRQPVSPPALPRSQAKPRTRGRPGDRQQARRPSAEKHIYLLCKKLHKSKLYILCIIPA